MSIPRKPKKSPEEVWTQEARRLIRQAGLDPNRFTDKDYAGWVEHHIQLRMVVRVALLELEDQEARNA